MHPVQPRCKRPLAFGDRRHDLSEAAGSPALKETRNQNPSAQNPSPVEARSPIDAFLDRARKSPVSAPQGGRGRLVFALDATMSRQPTWDLAQSLQGKMFETAANCGGLDVQFVYF